MSNKKTVDELSKMSPAQLDELPYGVIELSSDGTILHYNTGESEISGRRPEKVIGKNFFTEVAPCTKVQNFYGRFLDLIDHKAINHEFDFVFLFPERNMNVNITMLYEERENSVWVMINRK